MEQDIRCEQRFSNFVRALNKLSQAVKYPGNNYIHIKEPFEDSESGNVLDEIIKDGLIHRFEYTHELAWNVMTDYAKYQGNSNVGGSRDATREAFQLHLISDGNVWMDMIGNRNKTSHTYNEETSEEIYSKIVMDYYPAFIEFKQNMEAKRSRDLNNLL